MKQFKTILKFELMNYLKNKVFVGVTIFFVAVIAFIMFLPSITTVFDSDEQEYSDERSIMLIGAKSEENAQYVKKAFADAFEEYDVRIAGGSIEDIKQQIL